MLGYSHLPQNYSHKIFPHIHSFPTLLSSYFYSFNIFTSQPIFVNYNHILLLLSGKNNHYLMDYNINYLKLQSPSLFSSHLLIKTEIFIYIDKFLFISSFIRSLISYFYHDFNLSILFVSHINNHLHLFSSFIVHRLTLYPSKFRFLK